MHLYKQFFKLVWSNKTGIIIYTAIMAVMLLIISFVSYQNFENPINSSDNSDVNESLSHSYDISYVDKDNSELSRALIKYLGRENNCVDYSDMSEERISDVIYFSITSFHLDIPENFQSKVDKGEDTEMYYRSFVSGSSYIYMLESQVNAFLEIYSTFRNSGFDTEAALEKTEEVLDSNVDISVYSTEDDHTGPTAKEFCVYEATLFLSYISLGMLILSVGSAVIKSNNETVSKRIEAGPISVTKRTVINAIGIYSCGVILLVLYLAIIFIFAGETDLVKERGWMLALSTLFTIMYNCSITVLISSFDIKQNSLSMLANIVSISMSFICGVFVPQWLLGDTVNMIGKFLPFYWTVYTLNMIYPEGGSGYAFDMNGIWMNFGIELLFAIAFVFLAVMIKKMRNRQR